MLSTKASLKKLIADLSIFKQITALSSKAVILRYHSIKDENLLHNDSIGETIIHTTTVFDNQMLYIAENCNVLSLDRFYNYLSSQKKLPPNTVVVTFDDGFKDNIEVAAPVLNKYKIPATFYITVDSVKNEKLPWFSVIRSGFLNTLVTSWIDKNENKKYILENYSDRKKAMTRAGQSCAKLSGSEQDIFLESLFCELEIQNIFNAPEMMNFEDVHNLINMGHTIGSHTISHPNLAYISKEKVIFEMQESKRILENELKKEIKHFSYPNPSLSPNWSVTTTKIARESGYLTAVTSETGAVGKKDNPLILKRMWVPNNFDEFKWYLNWTFLGRKL